MSGPLNKHALPPARLTSQQSDGKGHMYRAGTPIKDDAHDKGDMYRVGAPIKDDPNDKTEVRIGLLSYPAS